MQIELHRIKVRDLVAGYVNDSEEGVKAYGGKLDVRPKYQREFVYNDKQRDAVMDTLRKGFPLNVMYWVRTGEDTYEVLDGQQRTISICDFVVGTYSIYNQYYHILTGDQQEQILDYELMVYICEGTDSEKLEWFKTINIAGETLSNQELRNAVYTGPWLSDAKRYFSRPGYGADRISKHYVSVQTIRQGLLELAIDWISEGKIEAYMNEHAQDKNAKELWLYFKGVIDWIETLFSQRRKEMKKVNWGILYRKYKDNSYDANELEEEVKRLMMDDDVTDKKGIYNYVLEPTRVNECHLSIRAFSESMKRKKYEEQGGICPHCSENFELDYMEGDHITPWSEGGKTEDGNLQMLCKECNRRKSNK